MKQNFYDVFKDLAFMGVPVAFVIGVLNRHWRKISAAWDFVLRLKFAEEFAELKRLRVECEELKKYRDKYHHVKIRSMMKDNDELELKFKESSLSIEDYWSEREKLKDKYKDLNYESNK